MLINLLTPKPTLKRYGLLFLVLTLSFSKIYSQSIYQKYDIYRNPIKVFLNKFSITMATGIGITNYSHKLSGVYFYQNEQNQFIFSNKETLGNDFIGYTNWLNNPQLNASMTIKNPSLSEKIVLINTDTASLGFKGASTGIPITLTIHYNFNKFRVGVGYSYEIHSLTPLKPTAFINQLRNYKSNITNTSYSRLFGMVGYKFYQFWSFDFVAELQLGSISHSKQFNKDLISQKLYTNIGISIENNWSEYFRLILRPSIELKSYTIHTPDGLSITHQYPTFFIQAGISINIPEIPRSPIKNDKTELKHVYTDPITGRKREVRGQSILKKQNQKIGENYRKPRKRK